MSVSFAGNRLTLSGNKVKVGDKAPDFTCLNSELNEISLNEFDGVTVVSVIPSIDTEVCDFQTRKFNEELSALNVNIITISNDLPFAQGRWCGAVGIENLVMLSDYRDLDFANNYGTLVKELRLQTRAVFVLNEKHEVTYVDYLDEINEHPNYDEVIKEVRELIDK